MFKRIIVLALVSLFIGSTAEAQPVHWWRLEAEPAFFVDSIGSSDLVHSLGTVAPLPLPASGRGSDFPGWLSGPTGGSNLTAAEFDASGGLKTTFGGTTGDFTVEAFIHADVLDDSFGHTIVASTRNFTGASLSSWFFQLRTDGFAGTAVGELVLAPSPGAGFEVVGSGFVIPAGKDYYVAAAFNLAGGAVTFYVQNLTDGGALQVSSKPHSQTSLGLITRLAIGGDPDDLYLEFDGLIDEVRLSDGLLAASELLVNSTTPPVAPIPVTSPMGAALLALGLFMSAARVLRH